MISGKESVISQKPKGPKLSFGNTLYAIRPDHNQLNQKQKLESMRDRISKENCQSVPALYLTYASETDDLITRTPSFHAKIKID